MGRATFSTRNAKPVVAITAEPEAVPQNPARGADQPCYSWRFNRFDPDSEDFFAGAQYEAPLNPDDVRQRTAEGIAQEVQMDVSSDSASDTSSDAMSEAGEADAGNTRDIGFDGVIHAPSPPMLVPPPWLPLGQRMGPVQNADNTNGRPDMAHVVNATRSYRPTSAASVPAIYVPATTASPMIAGDVPADQVPAAPRPAMATPAYTIVPPIVPSHDRPEDRPASPSPTASSALAPPSTPSNRADGTSLVSPSPPGMVTPSRPYTWQTQVASPASPTRAPRGLVISRESPLTNPRARMSYARLVHVPSPVFVQRAN